MSQIKKTVKCAVFVFSYVNIVLGYSQPGVVKEFLATIFLIKFGYI